MRIAQSALECGNLLPPWGGRCLQRRGGGGAGSAGRNVYGFIVLYDGEGSATCCGWGEYASGARNEEKVARSASVQAANPNCSNLFSATSQDKACEDAAVFTITGVSVILKISKVVFMMVLQVLDKINDFAIECFESYQEPTVFVQLFYPLFSWHRIQEMEVFYPSRLCSASMTESGVRYPERRKNRLHPPGGWGQAAIFSVLVNHGWTRIHTDAVRQG